jgi:uncharacterized membrane protein YphA (DoxX/SURF4 family)
MNSVLTRLEQLYEESKRNRWLRCFAVFCRIVLALGFLPAGIVKLTGERYTALPSNHPLGHYFDALAVTGYYYKFIGVGQLTAALLLLVPRTALLGAILYFPIILNICVLAYAVRFEGTRITTFMLLANVFLLVWDYDRLKHALLPGRIHDDRPVLARTSRFPAWFFSFVIAAIVSVVVINQFLFEIRPGNSQEECTNGCRGRDRAIACQGFCTCIYDAGKSLNACLDAYQSAKNSTPP